MLKIATQFHPDGSCSEDFSAVLIFSKCWCFVLLLILQIDVRNVGNKIIKIKMFGRRLDQRNLSEIKKNQKISQVVES